MKKGFTLIELLVVIAILALLMSIIIITLNPAEMLKKARDSKRIADLNALRTALNLYITDQTSPSIGTANYCYFSTPASTAPTCYQTAGCTTPYCVASTALRGVTGSGWIPVNFNAISSGSPLSALPVDPRNVTTSPYLYYSYAPDTTNVTFELDANMESSYFASGGSGDVESTDGGNASTLYEIGSDPGLDLLPTPTAGFYQ